MSEEPTRSTFTKVPHWLLPLVVTGMLKPQTLQVYAAIGMYVDWSTGKGAFPLVATLSRITGMSERTVQRHTQLLIAVGAIKSFERFRSDGGQTSNEVWLMEDPPEGGVTPVTGGGDTSDTPLPRAPYLEPSSPPDAAAAAPPTEVGRSTHLSSDEPTDSPPVPNSESSEQPVTVPVVLQRMLMDHGVTESAAPQWEAVWRAAWVAEWPDYAQMEAHQFPGESLTGYLSNCKDSGHHPSPGRWLQWFNDDRNRRIRIIDSQREQLARMDEDPAEREARQNRHLPPDRSQEFPAPTQAGAVQ